MTQITDLAEEYERKRDVALWWKLNEKMDALCQKLRRYQVFRLLLDEDEDAFFSAIRDVYKRQLVCRSPAYRPTDAHPGVLSTGRAAVLPVNTTS